MILTTALFGIKEAIMLLVIVIAISYFTVKALTAADNKDRVKAMKNPINVAKEMGLEISPQYEKDNEILVFGKNYAFVMKYFPIKDTYCAYIYEMESGKYKMSVISTDYNCVLKSAKELVENLDKI
ncbi:MAG: hypothetical protein J6T10_13015 [Methanobrevibacter sp.]|nr:hypothetical protein [Methanobrevibacter sp.]